MSDSAKKLGLEKVWEDPIVAELHEVREKHAAGFGHDLDAIFKDLKTYEKSLGVKTVALSPKILKKEPA